MKILKCGVNPLSRYQIQLSQPLNLTAAQEAVFKPIQSSLRNETPGTKPSVFLLHGVTASGKTEIYLQALAEAVKLGKRGIALVPEIALTPQTIETIFRPFSRKSRCLAQSIVFRRTVRRMAENQERRG